MTCCWLLILQGVSLMSRLFRVVAAVALLVGLGGCSGDAGKPADPKAANTNPNPKLKPAGRAGPEATGSPIKPQGAVKTP